ncbi:peptidase MA family metallohydrolase [Yinghuangia seranimata]|uniref:peptidase MA family metallohydrolase n=1 Tax=Yinghuangia seranimata TaxID=408067 RepID=UPI00248C37D1|nr:hypothetical protein [Yinghuangia seranimata]MDI2126405.1 hypothetical protein [Yinghuangia seranimata]
MDDSAPGPMVEGESSDAPISGGIPGQTRGATPYPAPGTNRQPTPYWPAPVPGAWQWTPTGFPGQRPPFGQIPYAHPGDPQRLWPHAVVDPRRDQQTPAIVALSLLAAVVTLIAYVGVAADRGAARSAGAAADSAHGETHPYAPQAGDPARPGGTNPTKDPGLTGPTASSSAEAAVLTRTQALAATRTTALRANDAAAFTRGLDKNDKALLDGQNRLFANLRKIPFDESTWNAKRVTDARTDPGATGGWPVTATVDVAFQHKITGADVGAVAEHYVWTVRCATSTDPCAVTKVVGADDSHVTGPSGYPAPWDLWDLAVERRAHVVTLGDRSLGDHLRIRADEAEAAATYDLQRWSGPTGTSPGFVIALTRERADFDKMYSRESAGDWAAGFALPLSASGDNDRVGGSRVVIDLTEMDRDAVFAKVILRHEMMHALLDPITRADFTRIPLWAAEGFADWAAQADRSIRGTYEARGVADLIHNGKFKGTLPTDADFDSTDEDVIDAAYNQAHLAIRYLADTYGADRACAFIADVYQGTSSSLDAAMRAATGKNLSEFEKAWADWTRKNFG